MLHHRRHFTDRIILMMIVLFLFLGSVFFGIHGFSISEYHKIIDQSPASEIIFGESRDIRSDDWRVSIPTIFAQRATKPPFLAQNPLYGKPGINLLAASSLSPIPVFHFISVFRPYLWGYFLGGDLGLGWHWAFYTLGLFCATFLVIDLLTERKKMAIALYSAIAVVYAPFFQFWSLNSAPMAIFSLLSLAAILIFVEAKNLLNTLLAGVFFWWTTNGFIFAIYPPYQVSMGYLCFFIFLGYFFKRKSEILKQFNFIKLAIILTSLTLTLLVCIRYFRDAQVPLQLTLNTVYPGNRVTPAGEGSWVFYFSNNLGILLKEGGRLLFGNICEGASFYLFIPLTVAGFLFSFRRKRKVDPLILSILLYLLLFFIWGGTTLIPTHLAKILGLGLAPARRTIIGIGLANTLLTALFLANPPKLNRNEKIFLSLGWLAGNCWLGLQFKGLIPGGAIFFGGIISFSMGYLLLIRTWKPALPLLAALSFLVAFRFNPIVHGGSDYLLHNPLAEKIREIENHSTQASIWITYHDATLSDLLRGWGVTVLNGTHFYPQFEFWKILDRTEQFKNTYNRYAHVVFEFPTEKSEVRFINPVADTVIVLIHPDHPKMQELGFNHLLFTGSPQKLDEFKRQVTTFRYLSSVGDHHLFERSQTR